MSQHVVQVCRFLVAALALGTFAVLPTAAAEDDTLVPDLEQRLADGDAVKVNAYLKSHWAQAMEPLNRRTARCDLQAVSLAIRLDRSGDAQARQAHNESLRAAVGACTSFVLALSSLEEIPRYCGSVSSWSLSQTARELRRRIAAIESDEVLRSSPRGKACRAAYLHELRNTRVVLKPRVPSGG